MSSWKPYNDHPVMKSNDMFFLIRPCGEHSKGKMYLPTIVRCPKPGVLVDIGNNVVRLNHHKKLEWTEIPL